MIITGKILIIRLYFVKKNSFILKLIIDEI